MAEASPERLHDLWLASRTAWPRVDVPLAEFERYVRERAGDAGDELNLVDLYLACGCSLGMPGALTTFEQVLLGHVPRFVARIDPSSSFADEVRQLLAVYLLVGAPDAPPRIVSYKGRGSLLAWLRTVAVHAALRLLRERDSRAEVELDEALVLDRFTDEDPELELIKARYRQEFEDQVVAALADLPRRDRNLLRLHLVAGISTTKLGTMFQVDQSTVVRWLAAARQRVRDAVLAGLGAHLHMSESELASLAGLMLSRLDVSLNGCLRSQGD